MQSCKIAWYCFRVARLENRLDDAPHRPEASTPANSAPAGTGPALTGAAFAEGGGVLARTLTKARWNIFWERL